MFVKVLVTPFVYERKQRQAHAIEPCQFKDVRVRSKIMAKVLGDEQTMKDGGGVKYR